MMRTVTYRQAVNAFLFTGLWFVFGAVVLWSPIPGALGIGGAMFSAWVWLFFAALGFAGILLTVAALNGIFPPDAGPSRQQQRVRNRATRRPDDPMWAPGAERVHSAGSGRREG